MTDASRASGVTGAAADARVQRDAGLTAFVLAGGGSHGAVQVGMLRALVRAGIVPGLVVGTSVGAINGAFFASDPTVRGVGRLADIWRTLRRRDVYPAPLRTWVPALLGHRSHLCDDTGLRRVVANAFGAMTFDDLRVPCAVVAADYRTSEEVVLREGAVGSAVLASAAVPVIFPPVALNGRLLVDGALCRNTPIHTAVALGATRVVVLPTGFACAFRDRARGAIATALHHVSVLFARQLANEADQVRAARPDVAVRVVPPMCPMPVSSYDFSTIAQFIADAERSTETWLADGGLGRDSIPENLGPHAH